MNMVIWGGLIILISACCALAFPFTTYATTLATFGIAHVAIELRYIDSRFHSQLDRTLEGRLVILLIAIALLRCCTIFAWLSIELAHILELGCGVGLGLLATQHLDRQNWQLSAIGVVVICLLGIGIIDDPIATSTTFAIVHNLTPIGFILERQGFINSSRTLLICGCIFGLIPLLLLLSQFFPVWQLGLETNPTFLSAFIAPSWQQSSIAYP